MNRANQKAAWMAVAEHHGRVTQLRALSQDAARTFRSSFPDNSIDWLYIDALHTNDALYRDLVAWFPKVRPGGSISGDDYGDWNDTYLMTATRWMREYGAVAKVHHISPRKVHQRKGDDLARDVVPGLLQLPCVVFY